MDNEFKALCAARWIYSHSCAVNLLPAELDKVLAGKKADPTKTWAWWFEDRFGVNYYKFIESARQKKVDERRGVGVV